MAATKFRHQSDGVIYLDNFGMSLAEFLVQRPAYSLPAGMVGRMYNGTRHILTDGSNQSAGPVPWPAGDEYLANADAIRAAVLTGRVTVPPRVPRQLAAIYSAVNALTTTQKTAIWADLSSGSPKKYLTDAGINYPAIAVLDWVINDLVPAATPLQAAKMKLAAMYTQDFPTYLVNPSFAPTINIPGDQPG